MNRERLFSIGFVLLATLVATGAEEEHVHAKNPNFDKREAYISGPLTLEGPRAVAADRLRARMEGVQIDLDNVVGSPKFIQNRHGFLSAPAGAREITHPRVAGMPPGAADDDPDRPIKEFLDENRDLFGHDSAILKGAQKARDYVIIGDAQNYPAYLQVTPSGHTTHVWAPSTSDIRALEKVIGPDRIAACWFAAERFTVEITLTDALPHRFGLYFLDWDLNDSRSQRVDVYDADSGFLADSRVVSDFSGGAYLSWHIAGHVRFDISRLGAANAVVSGLFLDP